MTEHDIRTAFGETPAAFRDQVELTLTELEDTPMKKRYKLSTMLLAAMIAVLALAGAGIAATQWKTFSFLQITPLEGADSLISTNLASTEDEYIRFDFEEAIFDGEGLIAQFRITPKQPDIYNLSADSCSLIFNEDNSYISCFFTSNFENSVLGADGLDSWTFESAGDSIIAYASHFGPPIDTSIQMDVQLSYCMPEPPYRTLTLDFTAELSATTDLHRYTIAAEPDEQPHISLDDQEFELIEGSFAYTDAFGYYELKLHCADEPAALFDFSDPISGFELSRHTNEPLSMRRSLTSQQYLEDEGVWFYYEKGIMQPFIPSTGDEAAAPVAEDARLNICSKAFDIFESIPVQLIPAD